jgi:two-component system probable response regulator PhcQ
MVTTRPVATVLLVDDDPLNNTLLSQYFPKDQYKVLTASSAAEAHQLLEWHCVDIIVSDECMPGESGAQFLAAVRQKCPDAVRIIHTGHGNLDSAIRAINEAQVHRFFLKPANPAELLSTIEQALAHKRLEKQSRSLLKQFRKMAAMLGSIEREHPSVLQFEPGIVSGIATDYCGGDELVDVLVREVEASVEAERRWQQHNLAV